MPSRICSCSQCQRGKSDASTPPYCSANSEMRRVRNSIIRTPSNYVTHTHKVRAVVFDQRFFSWLVLCGFVLVSAVEIMMNTATASANATANANANANVDASRQPPKSVKWKCQSLSAVRSSRWSHAKPPTNMRFRELIGARHVTTFRWCWSVWVCWLASMPSARYGFRFLHEIMATIYHSSEIAQLYCGIPSL